jgi:hypothetical protein
MLLRASRWMVVLAPLLTTDEGEMDMLYMVEASLDTARAVGA